jgi:uncharacterized protein DUF4446
VAGVELALAAGLLLALAGVGLLLRRVSSLERQLRRRPGVAAVTPGAQALQQVGLVRYQAYHDVGGDHSFALALLDAAGTGVVLNSLYHRDRCRVYAKPIRDWQSGITLTDEEKEAIERARAGADAPLTS